MKKDHESMRRLAEAANKKYPGETGSTAIARRLGEEPNTVTNWKTRGVSDRGAIAAEEAYGVSAVWILKGIDPIANPWPFKRVDEAKLRALQEGDRIAVETTLILEARRTFNIDIQRDTIRSA